MKYRIKYSGGFKKSYKLCKRRGYDIQLLEKAITLLANEGKLPPEYKAHILSGRLSGIWECHIAPVSNNIRVNSESFCVHNISQSGAIWHSQIPERRPERI